MKSTPENCFLRSAFHSRNPGAVAVRKFRLFEPAGLRRALLHKQGLIVLQLRLRTLEGGLAVDFLKGSGLHVAAGQLRRLHRDGLQRLAAVEGILADALHRRAQGELRQLCAALEGIRSDGLQLAHGREGLQHLASAEGAVLDGFDGRAALHGLQLCTVHESLFPNGLYVLPDGDRSDLLVSAEGAVRDGGDGHRRSAHGDGRRNRNRG